MVYSFAGASDSATSSARVNYGVLATVSENAVVVTLSREANDQSSRIGARSWKPGFSELLTKALYSSCCRLAPHFYVHKTLADRPTCRSF